MDRKLKNMNYDTQDSYCCLLGLILKHLVSRRCPGLNGIHKVLLPNHVRYKVTRCPKHPQWQSPKGLPRWEIPCRRRPPPLCAWLLKEWSEYISWLVSLPPWSWESGKIIAWVPFYWWKQSYEDMRITQPVSVMPAVRIPQQEKRRPPWQCNTQRKGNLLLTRARVPAATNAVVQSFHAHL